MNTIRAIVHSSFRGYRTNRGIRRRSAQDPALKAKIQMIQPHMPLEQLDETENDDFEDLDAYESDFANVGEFHKMHEKELEIRKAKLKTQIVKRKYFKSEEPAMLTWGEKEQIRLLHSQDPEEWSPERLSESFPASRDTILKVLRAKWAPKSTSVIEKYEKTVKHNWELFKAGRLIVDPELQAHLAKFSNREINIMDEETMKKFLKPKPVFKKPSSVVFSNIIQGYLNEHNASKKRKEEKKKITESIEVLPKQIKSGTGKVGQTMDRSKAQESLTFDMFLKKHVEGVEENKMTPVDRVIIDEYKQRNAETYKSNSLVFDSQSAVGTSKEMEITREQKEESSVVANIIEETSRETNLQTIDETSVETRIIARQKKEGVTPDVYPDFIKIPRNKYKPGVTYRVEDRYYDDDGEFLYRVPGLRS